MDENRKAAVSERYQKLIQKEEKIAVLGLGYVGLPLAVAFAETYSVIGVDINKIKIEKYISGQDPTKEVGAKKVRESGIFFTSDPAKLKDVSFIVVAVPTPIYGDKTPDLTPVIQASETVGMYLKRGTVVVFESTVYPGVTEEICVPAIERVSGLSCGKDFFIGYSPERVNPGDRVHTLRTITKIVSAAEEETLELMALIYGSIIQGGVEKGIYKVKSIRVAEAAKLLENSQRDVNIAFMNEAAMVLHRMGIDTMDVIRAMNTKWNALKFYPGLVGGHCISVDPYYFVYQAEKLGYHSSIILASRQVNDDLPSKLVSDIVREIVLTGKNPSETKIYILGMTFKGNCPDLRNTKSKVIKDGLNAYGLYVEVVDSQVDATEIFEEFGQYPVELNQIYEADCLIFAADHREYRELSPEQMKDMMPDTGCRLIIDVRNIFERERFEKAGFRYWAL